MRSASAVVAVAGALATACGGSPGTPEGGNVLPITVNGSLCSPNSYPNKPCVAVTVCVPGTSTCKQVTDVLLDTGSWGLRIFRDALDGLDTQLPQVTAGSGALAECAEFGDGTTDWGPIRRAGVVLGNEPAVTVPIQVIDWTFPPGSTTASLPSKCVNADRSPAAAGFNGILGVGVFVQDCGPTCVDSSIGVYYACSGSACGDTRVPLASQVQNPVALLARDGNGVVVQIPAVAPGGSPSVTGQLVLGIATQGNNQPAPGTQRYDLQFTNTDFFEVSTSYGGSPYEGSVDTGSNGLFFPDATLTASECRSDASWYCPQSTVSLSATNTGPGGSPKSVVSFQIGNFEALVATPNAAFSELGGSPPPAVAGFTWGLPFHFGRTVYVGIEGKSSSLGTGPYVAY